MGGKPSHLRFNVAQVLKKQEKSVEQEEQFQVQLERGSKQRGCSRGQRPVCKSLRSEVHSLRADLEAKASREAATRAKKIFLSESQCWRRTCRLAFSVHSCAGRQRSWARPVLLTQTEQNRSRLVALWTWRGSGISGTSHRQLEGSV